MVNNFFHLIYIYIRDKFIKYNHFVDYIDVLVDRTLVDIRIHIVHDTIQHIQYNLRDKRNDNF